MINKEVFAKAKSLLENSEWRQGFNTLNPIGICLMEAIGNCLPQNYLDNLYYDYQNFIADKIGINPVIWNDQMGRTKEEVLKLLDELANDQ